MGPVIKYGEGNGGEGGGRGIPTFFCTAKGGDSQKNFL